MNVKPNEETNLVTRIKQALIKEGQVKTVKVNMSQLPVNTAKALLEALFLLETNKIFEHSQNHPTLSPSEV